MGLLFKKGEIIKVQPKNNKDYSLKECQNMVGGYVEVVTLQQGKIALVDEEGALKPDKWLNMEAMLYMLSLGFMGALYGNVLIIDDKEFR